MKYIAICTIERETFKIGIANSGREATEIMQNDFFSTLSDLYTEEEIEQEIGRGDNWDYDSFSAWLNTDDNYDWTILEIS